MNRKFLQECVPCNVPCSQSMASKTIADRVCVRVCVWVTEGECERNAST